MKILWFANTPCGASQQLLPGLHLAGWLTTLEAWLVTSGQVELHVCFQWEAELPCFSVGGVTYHPIRKSRMRNVVLGRVLGRRFRHDSVAACVEVISRVRPDLIHVHGTEQSFGLLQAHTEIPVVVSIQGILTNIAAQYFAGLPLARFLVSENPLSHLRLKSVLSLYLLFLDHARRERRILALSRHLIGRTDWDRRSTGVLAPAARYHHGDEILRTPFYQALWFRSGFSEPLHILTVAGVSPYKGYEAVLKVSRILRDNLGLDLIWTVVGLEAGDTVVKVAHKWLGEQANVRLVGTRSGAELCQLLLDADLFCQVSHIENSPNSLCEAMLVGMPIVATFAGGTESMLRAGVEGILVQPGDPWSMAGAILELSRDFERAALMGQAARARARLRHDPETVVAQLIKTYRRILNQSQG